MNIDTIILIVLGAFFLIGFVRGFIREVGALLGFFLALYLANTFYPSLVPAIKPSLEQWPLIAQPLSVLIAYFGTFIGAQIGIGILVRLLDFLVKHFAPIPFLKTANRLVGGALGIVEGVFLLSSILFVLTNFPLSKDLDKKLHDSKFAPQIVKVAKIIEPLLPDISKFAPPLFKPGAQKNFETQQMELLKAFNINSLGDKKIPSQFEELLKEYNDENAKAVKTKK